MNSKHINAMFIYTTSHLHIFLEDANMLIKIETIPLNTFILNTPIPYPHPPRFQLFWENRDTWFIIT